MKIKSQKKISLVSSLNVVLSSHDRTPKLAHPMRMTILCSGPPKAAFDGIHVIQCLFNITLEIFEVEKLMVASVNFRSMRKLDLVTKRSGLFAKADL